MLSASAMRPGYLYQLELLLARFAFIKKKLDAKQKMGFSVLRVN
jgi:hypothetical protein